MGLPSSYSLCPITFQWMKILFSCHICSGPTPIVASNSAQVVSSHVDPPMAISNDSPTIESYGFSQRYVEPNMLQLDSRRFQNSNMGSGKTFPNVAEFWDAMYLMLLGGRF